MPVNTDAGVVQFTTAPLAVQPAIADCATSPVIIPSTDSRTAAERGFNLEEGIVINYSLEGVASNPRAGILIDLASAAPFSNIDALDELASRHFFQPVAAGACL
ncbi:hypothetical protein NA655_12830 [Pseudomonas kuykendallii]|uniref:hypothetical protein n=1 Tax=Pseudomonas kuykendallii TaxID=1007099 RepID=UPI0015877C94|nr:hypothetical protein [Pseudomonas kuykendallii]MCQ4271904.1 hypothetical protein [Pseudomonas kuykendallii]